MKTISFRRIFSLLIVLVMIFTVCSCSKAPEEVPEEEPETVVVPPEPVVEEEKEEVPEEEPEVPQITNPLTGEPVEEDISAARPIAIMINDYPIALPHLGVGDVDVLFEAPVEGGITRMMAVFQNLSEDTVLGSVRSCRHYYLDLAAAFDAIYVHAGASVYGRSALAERDVEHIDAVSSHGDLFYRDQYRRVNMGFEHSLCITGESLLNYINNNSGFRLEHEEGYSNGMIFSENPAPKDGTDASKLAVHFGAKDTTFYYDVEKTVYTAEQYSTTYIDGNTGETVEFKNIVVIQTDIHNIDSSGCKDVLLTGSGSGWFASEGKCVEINWSRDDMFSEFEYTFKDGTPVEFGIGSTYIGIIPMSSGISCE